MRIQGNGRCIVAAILIASATEVALAGSAVVQSPTPPSPRLYDVATETGMPHLEESLRYAVVRQRRCLDPRDLSRAFWMLDDVSLQDCRLEKTAQDDESAGYELRCDGGHGTTGSARWQIGPAWLRGTLDVRLGGKNMTFYQRVVAQAVTGDQLDRERPEGGGRIEAASSFSCSAR
jgi:hypothetical protein